MLPAAASYLRRPQASQRRLPNHIGIRYLNTAQNILIRSHATAMAAMQISHATIDKKHTAQDLCP